MDDFEGSRTPIAVHSWMSYFPMQLAHVWNLSLSPASSSWGTSNQGVYLPFVLPWDYPVARVFWANGSVLTGNGCLAIYTKYRKRLYSTGAIARSGASALQYVSVGSTPFLLSAGEYYLGLSIGTTTNGVMGVTTITAAIARGMGILQQASVGTLPDPMVPIAPTVAVYPLMGITRLAA